YLSNKSGHSWGCNSDKKILVLPIGFRLRLGYNNRTYESTLMINRPPDDRQHKGRRTTSVAFKKKNPNYQRGYRAIRNQPYVLRIPLREYPSLLIAPELDGGGSRRD